MDLGIGFGNLGFPKGYKAAKIKVGLLHFIIEKIYKSEVNNGKTDNSAKSMEQSNRYGTNIAYIIINEKIISL